jgi:ABC-type transport system substrate-binding protein
MIGTRRGILSLLTAVSASALLLFSGCGDDDDDAADGTTEPGTTATESGPKPPKGTLRIATSPPDYATLAPQDTSSQGNWLRQQTLDALVHVAVDEKGVRFEPQLAESWDEVSGKTTFHLRKGIQFHKGMGEFTCADAVFSINLSTAEGAVSASNMLNLKNFQAKWSCSDDYTLVVEHLPTYRDLKFDLSDWRYAEMQSKKYYESAGNETARKILVGTGSFEMMSIDATGMKFKAVENHWLTTPEFAELEWKFIPEASTRLAALTAGEVDIVELPISSAPQVKGDKFGIAQPKVPVNFTVGMWGGYVYDTRPSYDPKNPFLDERVREALNISIDRPQLIEKVLYGLGKEIKNSPYFWEGTPGYLPELKAYPFDLDRAKRLLAEAGYGGGLTVKFIDVGELRSGVPAKDIADALSVYWKPLNVKVEVQQMDQATLNSLRRGRDAQLNGAIFLLDATNRPIAAPSGLYGSKTVATFGERQDFDDLLQKFTETGDDQISKQLNRTAWEDFMALPFVTAAPLAVFNKDTVAAYPLTFYAGLQDLEHVKRK